MVTEQDDGPKATSPSARDRSVWDVAREAFENSLIEGDTAARRKPHRQPEPEQPSG